MTLQALTEKEDSDPTERASPGSPPRLITHTTHPLREKALTN